MAGKTEIVVVEDDMDEAGLIMRVLTLQKIAGSLVHLKDGEEALEYFFATGRYSERNIHDVPSVILLDIKMPKVNGHEVLQALKSDTRTKKIPVILFTSSKEDIDIAEGYNNGVNSYVVKPINYAALVTVLRELGLYWLISNVPPHGLG
ncbi:MAG: response regulator [Bacteroidota bacterium]|nr:response regulator [Bacteroidota bacterium]